MNKSPLNFLITIAFGGILWVIIAIFYGGTFSESLMLATATPEQFEANLRVGLGIAAILGIANCLYWYYYGNLDSTVGDLKKAKRFWWVSFILQVIVSVVILFVLVFINLSQGILTSNWLIMFGLISLLSWFFFWLCTFLMSPRNVKYIPLFK